MQTLIKVLAIAFVLVLVLCSNMACVNGQFVQGGYDSNRSNRIPFNKQHAPWMVQVPFPNDKTNGVQETVIDPIRGKSYSQYSFKPFTLLEVDLTSGKSNLINITIPNFEKYNEFVEVSSARLDSKGNYFAVLLFGEDNSLIVKVDISNRIGKVLLIERTYVFTSVLSERHGLYILGTSNIIGTGSGDVIALDSTTLKRKWTISDVYGREMILVNSDKAQDDVIYVADYNNLHKVRVIDGRIIASHSFPLSIDNIAQVSGADDWVSVTVKNQTYISVSIVNIDKKIEASIEVMSAFRINHVVPGSDCSYPIAIANQTGNALEIISIVKCEIYAALGGASKIIAVKSKFDKFSLKPLPDQPNLVWSTDTSTRIHAKVSFNTIVSLEYVSDNTVYKQYDITTGKLIKQSLSKIGIGYSFPFMVTSTNNKVYRYEMSPKIGIEAADL